MELKTFKEESYFLIVVKGDLDAASAIELDTLLLNSIKENHKKILIDCTGLEYISSPGIGVFTAHWEDCTHKGIKLVLFGLSSKVFNVFQILGLHNILPITTNKEQAKKIADGA
ncbi:STAS domain-containing protein [Hugenholtzia roseola]|uniref:STAS domain-containing protein n=1 Tax=Hugenholtzia roseola TaxID=1002 RepID=UPI00047E98D2|nr:STAS domain-containing protein [Hugenholtzia roseola]